MKKILITLFLLLTFFVFSEEIILKNGSVVNGTIVNETSTSYFVEMPTGILEVAKENVDTVKKDIDFSVPTKTTEIQPTNTANSNSPFVSLKDFKTAFVLESEPSSIIINSQSEIVWFITLSIALAIKFS